MIKVYFEHGTHAEMVAVFSSDEDYMKVSDQLDKSAEKKDCFVSESVIDEDTDEEIQEFLECIPTENVRKDSHQKLISGVIGGIIFFDNMITIIGSKSSKPTISVVGAGLDEKILMLARGHGRSAALAGAAILSHIKSEDFDWSPPEVEAPNDKEKTVEFLPEPMYITQFERIDEIALQPLFIDTKTMSPKEFGMRKGKAVNNKYTKKRR